MNQMIVNTETVLNIENAPTEDMLYLQKRVGAYDLTPQEAYEAARIIRMCPEIDLRHVIIRPADVFERLFHGLGFSYNYQTKTLTFVPIVDMKFPSEFASAFAHELRHVDQNNRGFMQHDSENFIWNDGKHLFIMSMRDYRDACNTASDSYFLAPWEADANAYAQAICGNYTVDPYVQKAYSLAKFYY